MNLGVITCNTKSHHCSTPLTFNHNFKNSTNRKYSIRVQSSISSHLSFYELLGIEETVSSSEIKQAYKHMALKYHPDVSPPDRIEENTKIFIQVQEAYEILSDPRKRAIYDGDLLSGGFPLSRFARKRYDEELKDKSQWKNRWQDQVENLKRRSMRKDSSENMSWGARMRKQRGESSSS